MAATIVTPTEFKAAFPEFDRAADSLVDNRLEQAEFRTSLDVWGDLQVDGIMWLAAHLLALSPQGREMRIDPNKPETLYDMERKRLERIVASGWRVADSTLDS